MRALGRGGSGYRLGFDIGGTFTDLVLMLPAGELVTSVKVLTTAKDLAGPTRLVE
ncbi:MAG: hypothetical protein OEU36_14895 [Gammaproteobacteria bacterium]|nr:hypothetical protein [Gammaproteobacteria bacterium]